MHSKAKSVEMQDGGLKTENTHVLGGIQRIYSQYCAGHAIFGNSRF